MMKAWVCVFVATAIKSLEKEPQVRELVAPAIRASLLQ
jgi:hypothetical protein